VNASSPASGAEARSSRSPGAMPRPSSAGRLCRAASPPRKALTDAKSKRDRGERTSDPRLTFNAAADAWWAARVVKLRPTTQSADSAALRHLRAAFGRRRLAASAPPMSLATSRSAMRRADRRGRDDGPVGRLHLRRPPSWPPGQSPVTLLDHVERPSSADEKPKRILAGDGLRACSPRSSPSTASSSRRPPRRAHGWPRPWASFGARSISTRRPITLGHQLDRDGARVPRTTKRPGAPSRSHRRSSPSCASTSWPAVRTTSCSSPEWAHPTTTATSAAG